jgi:hypothetical protein
MERAAIVNEVDVQGAFYASKAVVVVVVARINADGTLNRR